ESAMLRRPIPKFLLLLLKRFSLTANITPHYRVISRGIAIMRKVWPSIGLNSNFLPYNHLTIFNNSFTLLTSIFLKKDSQLRVGTEQCSVPTALCDIPNL